MCARVNYWRDGRGHSDPAWIPEQGPLSFSLCCLTSEDERGRGTGRITKHFGGHIIFATLPSRQTSGPLGGPCFPKQEMELHGWRSAYFVCYRRSRPSENESPSSFLDSHWVMLV